MPAMAIKQPHSFWSRIARAVRREDITEGAAILGVPVEEHIATVITAMQGVSEALGL